MSLIYGQSPRNLDITSDKIIFAVLKILQYRIKARTYRIDSLGNLTQSFNVSAPRGKERIKKPWIFLA